MAIKQLTDEQIRTWTLEQKDRWWYENVWKGDMPQLTIRSALTGMMLGMVLSLTNLYVGAKTGWTLGVGITSVILAFAMFKVLSRLGLGREFTVLENNCMQSIATAAGYMTAPMISSLAAYMLVTDSIIPMWQTIAWIVSLGLLGVLFAFPLKRRFINEEQHPFPEGRAAGIVMDSLHEGHAGEALLKAKLLVIFGSIAALIKLGSSQAIMSALWTKVLVFWGYTEQVASKSWLTMLAIPEYLDGWIYTLLGPYAPRLWGTELRQLTVRPDTDIVMMAAGGLMGIRTGASLMIGAVINYCYLAPLMIALGDIHGVANAGGGMDYGFKRITMWALWWGVAMMTTASLYSFFSRPQILISAFRGLLSRRDKLQNDPLKNIELPMRVFVVGIPIVGALVVTLAHLFFDVAIWEGTIAVPLIFIFTLIGVNSTALTSITPTGALGKLTQLTYGAISPGNIKTNLATAGITAEVAGNAANLLMDIKPGYMLGGKPRQQALGHVLGILAGAALSVPVFYLVFLRNGLDQLISDQYPMPGATIWRAVAEVLTKGISNLEYSACWAALIGAVLGLVLEVIRVLSKNRFWISGVGVGLAAVIPFNTCLAMFLGALFFWLAERFWGGSGKSMDTTIVRNQEPICAGLIAGGALMGIAVILVENFLLAAP